MNEPSVNTIFQADGLFSITAPDGWRNANDPDVPLLLAAESAEGSGIFIDFKSVDWTASNVKAQLVEASESFFNDSVVAVESRDLEDMKSLAWGSTQYDSIRTWARFKGAYTWLIQFVYWRRRQLLFILHWNGPTPVAAETVNAILDTFKLLNMESDVEAETEPPPGASGDFAVASRGRGAGETDRE